MPVLMPVFLKLYSSPRPYPKYTFLIQLKLEQETGKNGLTKSVVN